MKKKFNFIEKWASLTEEQREAYRREAQNKDEYPDTEYGAQFATWLFVQALLNGPNATHGFGEFRNKWRSQTLHAAPTPPFVCDWDDIPSYIHSSDPDGFGEEGFRCAA